MSGTTLCSISSWSSLFRIVVLEGGQWGDSPFTRGMIANSLSYTIVSDFHGVWMCVQVGGCIHSLVFRLLQRSPN